MIVTCSKGMEMETFLCPSGVIREVLKPEGPVVVVSGPSHAEEVARKKPASVVVASQDPDACTLVQEVLACNHFRTYSSNDSLGVELAGALKNIIAIAAGICDGLSLGDNAKSALITRGLVEMVRFGTSFGAKKETFYGLSGLGDLVTTCFSPHGRNRAVGEKIGRGQDLGLIQASMEMVAEGIGTTRAVHGKAGELGIEMPITEALHRILFQGSNPREELMRLMRRPLKSE